MKRNDVNMPVDKDVISREREEDLDVQETVMPPEDIVAFTESRSCADLFRLYIKEQLEIQPEFQRGIVWSTKDQSLFIDSLIKQLPIPSLCISLDVKTQKRIVIDGLQRLWSIIQFLNYQKKDWLLSQSNDIDSRISGKKVSYIAEHESVLFDKLENLTIPITVIRCDYSKPVHMKYLFQIFRRLNSGGSKLLNQEIRNCIFQGPLNTLLRSEARSEAWLKATKTTVAKVSQARFGHEERILRFFAMYTNWRNYKGNLSGFLNRFMDDNKSATESSINRWRDLFQRTLAIVNQINIVDYVQKNKNLYEGLLIGVAVNLKELERSDVMLLNQKFQALLKSKPYAEDVREGMAHTVKVKERLTAAIRAFGEVP